MATVSKQRGTENRKSGEIDNPPYRRDDDEISLTDLLAVLVRRKAVILGAIAMSALFGIAVAMLRPQVFVYSTVLEIASDQAGAKLIETPTAVNAKLNDGYIPMVLRRHRETNPNAPAPSIRASIPRDSQIIVVEAEGTREVESVALALLSEVTKEIAADHERTTLVQRQVLGAERDKLRNQVASLHQQVRTLEAQFARTEETARRLTRQRSDAQKLVESGIANRKAALREIGDEAKALTLLMIDNDIRQAYIYINDIDRRLNIDLATQRDELQVQIADTKRDIANLEDEVH